ncbi:MAG: pyridoxal-5'-phosphate-dependent protein subunit beta [Myxococcota bacterium]
MATLGLETDVVDPSVYAASIEQFRTSGTRLPTFGELADPSTIPAEIREALEDVDPDAVHPLNLFRVHWYNGADRKTLVDVPEFIELPSSLTGVEARIVVALGQNFPMITAHKVLAAYGCLAPRLITGQFDPGSHRAIWPSTGNYCRGGIAISRILECRGVAVLPEGMSQERFDWLDEWVLAPEDVIRTYGSESNVKEIYDACNALEQDPTNIIFNQFCEYGNHLVHRLCTGRALSHIFETLQGEGDSLRLKAFVSATGSAGTIAAGDHLKERFGAKIVALEALECPTLLYNGFGEHNIQGIGDKHIPYIHNAMNTDFVAAISDAATDSLGLLFNTDAGKAHLIERKGVDADVVERLNGFGFSGIANVLGAIKMAKYHGYGKDDVIMTVATDGMPLYTSELEKALEERFCGRFDAVNAGEVWGQHLAGMNTEHLLEMSQRDKERMFNLGYFTWVEQQGVDLADFERRKDVDFWKGLEALVPKWDAMITAFNAETGASA